MNDFATRYHRWGFVTLAVISVILALWFLTPFVQSLLWATVLSVLMAPFHKRVAARRSPNVAAGMTTLTAIGLVLVPILIVSTVFVVQANSFVSELSMSAPAGESGLSAKHIVTNIDEALQPVLHNLGVDNFSLSQWFERNGDQVTQSVSSAAGKAATSFGRAVFTLVIAFLTMFFMLRDGHRVREPALALIPLDKERSQAILDRMEHTIHGVFVAVVLVALIQGTAAGLAYTVLGVPSPVMWGVITIILCAIPLLGAPVIYVPMSLVLLAQGHYWQGFALLGWGFIVVSNIDNLLRPWVIGSRLELHPMAVFFSLLGGVFALGPIGLMAGPLLLTLLLAIQDIIRERLQADPVPAPSESPA